MNTKLKMFTLDMSIFHSSDIYDMWTDINNEVETQVSTSLWTTQVGSGFMN